MHQKRLYAIEYDWEWIKMGFILRGPVKRKKKREKKEKKRKKKSIRRLRRKFKPISSSSRLPAYLSVLSATDPISPGCTDFPFLSKILKPR
jgi:hypothetical protein